MNFFRKLSQLIFLFIFIFLISLSRYNLTFLKNFPFVDFNILAIIYNFFLWNAPKFIISIFTIFFFLVIGRSFCGWICPLGTCFDFISGIFFQPSTVERKCRFASKRNFVKSSAKYHRLLSVKYKLLFLFIVLIFFSIPLMWIIEPLTFFTKIFSVSLLPVFKFFIYKVLELLSKFTITQNLSSLLFSYLNEYFVLDKIDAYQTSIFFALIFLLLGILNYYHHRFWCKVICPLGALLGIFSKIRIIKIKIANSCIKCYKCVDACLMDAVYADASVNCMHNSLREDCNAFTSNNGTKRVSEKNLPVILSEECIFCDRCREICPSKAVYYKFELPNFSLRLKCSPNRKFASKEKYKVNQDKKEKVANENLDLEVFPYPTTNRGLNGISRREFLTLFVGGILVVPFLKFYQKGHKRPINFLRPPGSRKEDEFVARCIRCGKCITICPTNGLQPSLFESGVTGIWTPHLVPRIGSCQYNCNFCGMVCPTSAIMSLTLEQKRNVKIGTAVINRDLCLWWRGKSKCQICEEFCPYPDKAIKIVTETKIINGKKVTRKGPIVKEELCVGCGICENLCPVKEAPAIYILNLGEKRA